MKTTKRRRAACRRWVADCRSIDPVVGSDLLDDIELLLAVARRLRACIVNGADVNAPIVVATAFLDSEDT